MKRIAALSLAAALLGWCDLSVAQITYGGSPWSEGTRPEALHLPAIDRAALAQEDGVTDRYKEAPWRFGVEHAVSYDAVSQGAWSVEHGCRVWRLVVAAPGATNLSLRFATFDVPKGCLLYTSPSPRD